MNTQTLPSTLDEEEETELNSDSLWWEHQSRLRSPAVADETNPLEDDLEDAEADDGPNTPNRPLSASPLDQQTQQTTTPSRRRDYSTQVRAAHESPRCAHLRASGVRCGSPALRGSSYCYYHDHFHGGPRLIYPALAKLDDAHGIQTALMEVLTGILDRRLENKTGALLLYGLQTAVANLKHMDDVDPDEVATELPEDDTPQNAVGKCPEEEVEAEYAVAAAGARASLEHLARRHPIPARPSGDAARDASQAELLASYFSYDPDALPPPTPPNRGPAPSSAASGDLRAG